MEGVTCPEALTLEYCWQLIQEYSILRQSQIFVLLKAYGRLNGNDRNRLVKRLKKQWHIHSVTYKDESYLANKASLRPENRLGKQVISFWVLLDYFPQVDKHFATGTFTRISMEIQGIDYDIVYVEKGQEMLCMAHMRKNGGTQFIVIVEDTAQISLIESDRIRVFATIGKYGAIEYYTIQE